MKPLTEIPQHKTFEALSEDKKILICLCCSWRISEIINLDDLSVSAKIIQESIKTCKRWIANKQAIFNEIYDFVTPMLFCEQKDFKNCDIEFTKGIFSSTYALLYTAWVAEGFQRTNFPEVKCHYDSILAEVTEDYAKDCLTDFQIFSKYCKRNDSYNFIDELITNYSNNSPKDILEDLISTYHNRR